ncbi:hypothetical protein ONZ45_g6688 [Pleurotus djamor]|nr:hypothetical protein ONZ45_g6688 [Pleurotus djamor]
MVSRPDTRLVFNKVPSRGLPVPGETTIYDVSQTNDLDDTPLNGGFLVETLCVSLDVYAYARMVAAGGTWVDLVDRTYIFCVDGSNTASEHEPFRVEIYGDGIVLRWEVS